MLIKKEQITNFLPHRAPIVMIDNLLDADEEKASTDFYIDRENIFVSAGSLREPGLIENIAQTAAVQLGYLCVKKKQPVPLGYLAAIRDLKVHRLPVTESKIDTHIQITNRVLDVTLIEGQVTQGGEVVCSCEMRIYIRPKA